MNSHEGELRALKDEAINNIVWLSACDSRRSEIMGEVNAICIDVEKALDCNELSKALLSLMDVEALFEVISIEEKKVRARLHEVLMKIGELVHKETVPWESRS